MLRMARLMAGVLVFVAGSVVGIGVAASARAGASPSARSTIPVGLVCSCTGPEASSTSVSAPALRAWASYVNAHGGVGGHHVDLIVKDDETNSGTALAEVEQLVTQDHIVALIDNSDVDAAFATYVAQHRIPVIGSYVDSAEFFGNADFFPNGTTSNWQPQDVVASMKKIHATKLAMLYCAEVAICKQSVAPIRSALEAAGMHMVYTASISASAPNYTAQCLAAKQTGASAMFVGDASAIVTKVATECQSQGFAPRQIGFDGTVAESWRTTPSMNGNIDIQPDIPFFVHSTRATKAMYSAIRRYQPTLLKSPDFGEVVVEAWTSGMLFRAAAEKGGIAHSPTSHAVLKGLYHLRGTTLGGMTPPLRFTREKPTTGIKCMFFMGIHHEKWTLPIGVRHTCPS